MTNTKEIVERLRARLPEQTLTNGEYNHHTQLGEDLADAVVIIEQQAAEIERLKAAVSEAICHLSPTGCKAMNRATKEVERWPEWKQDAMAEAVKVSVSEANDHD